jgi:imidazolonepropionase-like amidohydrolase
MTIRSIAATASSTIALGVLLSAASEAHAQAIVPFDHLAIAHVTVVDVRDGRLLPDRTALVDHGRITMVAAASKVHVPSSARIVDGRGAYLIPGLWDMHAHSDADASLRNVIVPLEVANGITGVRDMFGTADALAARREIARGTLLGPRMVVGSAIVDGPHPMWEGSVPASSEADGRRVVDSLAVQGYDFIKIYSFLPKAAFAGVALEARRRHIPFEGHVPLSVSAGDASAAGQRSLEHAIGIALACSTDEERVRAELVGAAAQLGDAFPPHAALLGRSEYEPLASFSAAKCSKLFARLVRNDTWVVPTLVVHRAHANALDSATRHDPRLRYMPESVRRSWEAYAANRPPVIDAMFRKVYPAGRAMIPAMRRARVKMLAGSDAMNPFVIPGFSLHEELALLVEAGLTPLEALQAATISPAIFLHATDSLGTVTPGKLADLVLLDANPLVDVHNLDRIRAVIVGGRYLDHSALTALLEAVASTVSARQ